MSLSLLKKELRAKRNPEKARFAQGFFRSGPGEYAEGDKFLGLTVPETRAILKKYRNLPLKDFEELLASPWHEERLAALVGFVHHFNKGDDIQKAQVFQSYLKHSRFINNWDLVDVSAPSVFGAWLYEHPSKKTLFKKFASSRSLWERRIAIVGSHAFIRQGEVQLTLRLCRQLLNDPHDLIHKACGWMLREVGKRDEKSLTSFLNRWAGRMPRTMLRYSLERLTSTQKQSYMRKKRFS